MIKIFEIWDDNSNLIDDYTVYADEYDEYNEKWKNPEKYAAENRDTVCYGCLAGFPDNKKYLGVPRDFSMNNYKLPNKTMSDSEYIGQGNKNKYFCSYCFNYAKQKYGYIHLTDEMLKYWEKHGEDIKNAKKGNNTITASELLLACNNYNSNTKTGKRKKPIDIGLNANSGKGLSINIKKPKELNRLQKLFKRV